MVEFNGNLYLTDINGSLYVWTGGATLTLVATGTFGSNTNCLIEFQGSLFFGAGDGTLQEWDGVSSWVQKAPVSSISSIFGIVVFNDEIYASGFSSTSNLARLLKWNGSNAWIPVTSAVAGDQWMTALAIYNDAIYGLTGNFAPIRLYRWDNVNSWVFVSNGASGFRSDCMLQFGLDLFVGGQFDAHLWKWDGASFTTVGTYNDTIYQLAEYNGGLFGANGSPGQLVRWDEITSWDPASSTFAGDKMLQMAELNGNLYVSSLNGNIYQFVSLITTTTTTAAPKPPPAIPTSVIFRGSSPVLINGDLIVESGVCDFNGLDVHVGT
jgi:hypothetical protein